LIYMLFDYLIGATEDHFLIWFSSTRRLRVGV
jgi:hypothetical protein